MTFFAAEKIQEMHEISESVERMMQRILKEEGLEPRGQDACLPSQKWSLESTPNPKPIRPAACRFVSSDLRLGRSLEGTPFSKQSDVS